MSFNHFKGSEAWVNIRQDVRYENRQWNNFVFEYLEISEEYCLKGHEMFIYTEGEINNQLACENPVFLA